MSRQQKDADTPSRSRPRANTASFPSFAWRRQRLDQPSPPAAPTTPAVSQHTHSLEELLDALSPPAVPSLAYARALAGALINQSPLPRAAVLNPVLASLCDVDSPVSFQAAGHDILSAYWENHEARNLATADRLSYFSLFLGPAISWAIELWEPRFKALRALTKWGTDIIGIETPFLNVLKSWIDGAFEGLLRGDLGERTEVTERERSIDVIAAFLTSVVENPEIVARISEEELAGVLQFYAGLVDRSIVLPIDPGAQMRLSSGVSETNNSNSSTPSKPTHQTHRRNHSSVSVSSIPSPTTAPLVTTKIATKHPAELAITHYLNHLTSQLKTLSPIYLNNILPVLFRALAFCSTPLARLTVVPAPPKKSTKEENITETLNTLFAGPYSTTCMLILKQHLFPPDNGIGSNVTPQSAVASLFEHDIQAYSPPATLKSLMQTSLGAHRTLRNYVRRALSTRLARAYIQREASMGYSHTGAPGHIDMERDLMERAWPKEDYMATSGSGIGGNGWDAARLGRVLAASVQAWVLWHQGVESDLRSGAGTDLERDWERERQGKEAIMEEAAGILKDILHELDAREDETASLEEDEATVVGETLLNLANYCLALRNPDGTPFILPVKQPTSAPTTFLRSLASLMGRDHTTFLSPLLSNILISIAECLLDSDTAQLPRVMAEQHDLSPTCPEWLDNWENLLGNPTLVSSQRPLTRSAIMEGLEIVFESVRDMKNYRRPLTDLVWRFCDKWAGEVASGHGDGSTMWKILGDEVVSRTIEHEEDDVDGEATIERCIGLLVQVALEGTEVDDDDADTASVFTVETHSPSPPTVFATPSAIVSPILSRMQSEYHGQSKDTDKESGLPSVMSILSSLATGNASRSQSMHPQVDDTPDRSQSPFLLPAESTLPPRAIGAVSALVGIFSQIAFTTAVNEERNLALVIRIYETLLKILSEGGSTRARLTVLQFLMRLRADRDHRLYYRKHGYDKEGHITMLSSLINRVLDGPTGSVNDRPEEPTTDKAAEGQSRRARPRIPQERNGRQQSRGRGAGDASRSAASRSRSRAHALATPSAKPRSALWYIPESLPFVIAACDSPSEALVSYDPEGPDHCVVLPVSKYLTIIIDIIEHEKNWEVLSYILCHLPIQLANKHLFCGPRSRQALSRMLNVLCSGILSGELGSRIDHWPPGLKARDAQGLAHHTLSVLISYRRCFELQQRHLLVEVFQAGLNGQFSTIKCCLHALSLSAFELQPSMTKCLPRILEKLSQIMSNPNMAVHILGFLTIIGSLPSLYVNFTEADFKMVFGVALQYLQHYNRLNASPTVSWALSQHVRILSYYVVYVWFLAVKLPDRPHHVRYITRQLLLANEANDKVDDPTEVCFDWLARYTYASADPRPANSLLNDVVMNPSCTSSPEISISEKTWMLGNSVVTIRTLCRLGWAEVLSRRPSGFTKFLCRVENVPLVGPGDVDPDTFSGPAALLMERGHPKVTCDVTTETAQTPTDNVPVVSVRYGAAHPVNPHSEQESVYHEVFATGSNDGPQLPHPDAITGYVWSGSAPSQRRKAVSMDPSFLALQMSSYPDRLFNSNVRMVTDTTNLPKFFASLDRIPVIDTHKVGIMYVAPGQTNELDILRNTHGSPAYTRFLEGIGRLINLRGQLDVYAGGLDPDEDGEYAYAWWDDIGQILYHTTTMMPSNADDPQSNNKKRHIGNDYVRIVWNDSGLPYLFDTLTTQFQFVNIVIEPHSLGAIAAFSNNIHENEYFKVTVQRAPGMTEFAPVGHFKLISAENLPLLVRQLSLLADWFASVFAHTHNDTVRIEMKTNWHNRLEAIRRLRGQMPTLEAIEPAEGVMGQEAFRDFTAAF